MLKVDIHVLSGGSISLICLHNTIETQCHLLAMRDLSFQTAKDKCVADELAMKANDLYMGAAAKGDAEVNLLRNAGDRGRGSSHRGSSYRGRGPPASQKSCSCCGWQGHTSGDCRMREAVCYKCQQKGHMQRVCTATSGVGGATRHEQGASQASKSKSRSTKYVNEDESNTKVLHTGVKAHQTRPLD